MSRKIRSRVTVILAVVLGGAALAVGETIVVNGVRVPVRDKAGSAATQVASVTRGTQLEKLGEQGDFIRIRTPEGVEGFVSKKAINPAGGKGLDLSGLPTGTADPTASAGVKPVLPGSKDFAVKQHYDTTGVDRMIAARHRIEGAPLSAFAAVVKPPGAGKAAGGVKPAPGQ